MSDSNEAIRAVELTKIYKENLAAVDHVSFSVMRGEIFGFLGLNGAGKTTTIKMLATLIPSTSGSISVFGLDTSKHGLEIRKQIGVVQQKESYDRNLTVLESLRLYASLWGMKKEDASKRIQLQLSESGLEEYKKRKVRWLSFGQRRRLQVAREFLHDTSLLVLDEPTAGMDVLARHSFLDLCRETVKNRKTTIFYTTHIVSEAEYLCDRVAIIDHGKIMVLDSPAELKKRYGGVKTVSVISKDQSDIHKFSNLIDGFSSLSIRNKEVDEKNNEIRLLSPEPFKLAYDVSSLLIANGYDPESISILEPSLENVILSLFNGQGRRNN
jgi:ABC-2 type transport system ATP-binding protein